MISSTMRASRLGSIFLLAIVSGHGAERQQRFEVRNALRGWQLGKQTSQVGIGLELIRARGLHQTVETGAGPRAIDRIAEEPVAAPEGKRPDGIFGEIRVDREPAVLDVAD